jgi:hypothetical protein
MANPDRYERLLEAADDYELSVIETAAERAGLIWQCWASDGTGTCWTNSERDAVCQRCGNARTVEG